MSMAMKHRTRTVATSQRGFALLTGERKTRRPNALAPHSDFRLHELDELNEFRNGIEPKQREKPAVEIECRFLE